jgi:redox-sensitive bicupin YhaK (pirin superfamily)
VLEGALAHRDSTGTSSVIQPGEAQRMSAGTGISHSEYNPSQTEPVHFLQIWIVPNKTGLPPGYEQRAFPLDEHRGKLTLIASKDARDGSLTVHQDVDVWAGRLTSGEQTTFRLKPNRYAWLQIARGAVTFNHITLNPGDGAAVNKEEILEIRAAEPAELLLFDFA